LVSQDGDVVGGAGLHLVGGARLLHPREQVFEAMLEGWRNQRLARNLAHATVEAGEQKVRAFARHVDVYPWDWTRAA
jgi:integrase/recombinase XerC